MTSIRTVFVLLFLNFTIIPSTTPAQNLPHTGNYWSIFDSKILKINSKGQAAAAYGNLLLGQPTSLDTSDPFRIMVFFRESQCLVFLNSNATIIGKPLYIFSLGLGEVTLACRSERGGAWLFHRENGELLKYDGQFSKVEQRIILDADILSAQPEHITEHGGMLFVSIGSSGIARFDTYGARLENLNIPHHESFIVNDNDIWTLSQGIISKYSLTNPNEEIISYIFDCGSTPLIINGEPFCFDGERLILCKKIDG